MAKLSLKRQLFCKEYLIDLNATQAATRAGYSKKTAKSQGQRLLTNVDIAENIQELMSNRSEKVEISSDWVLESLKSVANRCMTAEQVMVRGANGMEPSGEYKFDSAGANKSLELIGKHLKLFTEKIEVEANVVVTEIKRKIV